MNAMISDAKKGLVNLNNSMKLNGIAPIMIKGNRFPQRSTKRVDLSHICPIKGSLNIFQKANIANAIKKSIEFICNTFSL